MKNLSTGTGIALLAGAIVAYPILDRVIPKASANVTHAGAGPTVVWMGVTSSSNNSMQIYHRLWSDGKQEVRTIEGGFAPGGSCGDFVEWIPSSCSMNWRELPPSPSGNGFACRTDLDGNRVVDGADLGLILANWGPQTPCSPEPEYPCMTIAGGSGLVK